jgi:hypothetical protein
MDTLMASSEPKEPQRPKTESEKVAQYRTDYRASLESVVDVVAAKVDREVLTTKMNQARSVVPALVNQVIHKAS